MRLPDFIGVGPPRTATTWLHEVLSSHVGLPEGVKETDYFLWQYDKGLEWYAAHFRNCPHDRPVGEFSPNYFVNPKVRERIKQVLPSCQIICTLRDPVERTFSHFRKMREGGYFSGSFEECLEKRPRLLEWSKYATYVKIWQNLFNSSRVLVLLQDDIKKDARAFLNQVCDFLGIPRYELPDSILKDKTINAIPSLPRNPRLASVARRFRDGLQRRGNYAMVNLLKKTRLRDFLFSGGPSFEPLSAETEARLREFFRPEVEALEKMLGRDLSSWKTLRIDSKCDPSNF